MVMSRQRKLLLFSCFILIDVLLIGGIVLLREVTLKNVLNNEVNALIELDFFKDRYNSKVKSNGDYAIVEKAIKSYLDAYAVKVQEVTKAMHNSKLNSLLLVGNIEKNGPLFETSLSYIESYQNDFNTLVDDLGLYLEDNDIDNYIYKYTDDEEVIELYRKVIDEKKVKDQLEKSEMKLVVSRIDTNNHIDAIRDVLTFLRDNNGNYQIVSGEVNFNNTALYAEYVILMDKTKRIY